MAEINEGDDYTSEASDYSFDDVAPRSSYIQGRSIPTTPSILSRSSSRSHLNMSRNGYSYDGSAVLSPHIENSSQGYDSKNNTYYYAGSIAVNQPLYDRDDNGAIIPPAEGSNLRRTSLPRAKSSSTLLSFAEAKKGGPQRLPRDLQPLTSTPQGPDKLSRRSSSGRRNRNNADHPSDSWLHRAGLAITSEARESKGQTWLVGRDSSSSLATMGEFADIKREVSASALSSQLTSRFASARQSRHISRRGSGSKDLANPFNDTSNITAYGAALRRRLLAEVEAVSVDEIVPDFVNAKDAEELYADLDGNDDDGVDTEPDLDVDDIEVARLASKAGLGLGLGAWVDKLVGWAFFGNLESESEVDDEHRKEEENRGRDLQNNARE